MVVGGEKTAVGLNDGDALLTTRRRFPNCHIAMDLSEDILYLPMDPLLVKQVIVNLLENAPPSMWLSAVKKPPWALMMF